ncbi:MAG: carboxypeptidase-like regulatory domain-containing protein, partial [Abditibacteriales bacterium]|nr:carboxypeptidase-like regulatory domain-containing protein [Abditibacteriales bacterium]MDW8367754.1 carboxypeptidase-like regulatory domain-containing protein [Abditibacteriales bacterium]
ATSPAQGFNAYPRPNDEGTVVTITAERGQYQAEILLRGPASVIGRVVDEKKKPVAGAQVQMSPSSGGVVQSAITDASGVFRMTPLRSDVYRLTVHKEGYASYADNVSINDGVENKIQDIPLTFLGFGAVRGRVVSAQGTTRTPVRGAQVSWRRPRGEGGVRVGGASGIASWQGKPVTTDENGVFQLESVPAGIYDVVVAPVNGPVIVRERVLVKRNETTTLSEIVIPPTGTLAGTIRTPDGSPIPPATEVIVGPPGMSGGLVPIVARADTRLPWMSDQYAAWVNKDGTFKITGILPGKYEVIARGPGLLAPAPQVVEIRANQTTPITLTTPRSGRIVGRVSSLATSQPIAGAHVYLYDPISNETLSATTDAAGHYAIERVRPGVTRVVCRHRGYALATRFDIAVEADETAVVDFLLTPGGAISGRVKGRLAQRAYDSSLQVAANGNLSMAAYVRADGTYRIENLPPGVYNVDLFLGTTGVLSVSGVVVEEGRETTGIDFELPPR